MASRHVDLRQPLRGSEAVRAVLALVISLGAVIAGRRLLYVHSFWAHLRWPTAILVAVLGALSVRWDAVALGKVVTQRISWAAGSVVRLIATGVGVLLVVIATLTVVGVSLGHLLLGAGVAGIVVGVAAQQSMANLIASLVLLFARPFAVDDDVIVRSGAIGVIEGHVVGIGLTYVTLRTDVGVLKVPNSVILASGIGRPSAHPSSGPRPHQ